MDRIAEWRPVKAGGTGRVGGLGAEDARPTTTPGRQITPAAAGA